MATRTFLEFFAGGGMARAGLGDGWRCLFANDFDQAKADAYAAAWGRDGERPPELKVGDVGLLKLADLPAERADLAWASFPCQDLSLAGPGAGLAGERSGSFLPFHFLMMDLRREGRAPRAIVLENVCGLLTSHGGRDFADICGMLSEIGYRYGALVMDAAEFLPQSRPRLFVVAVDRKIPVTGAAGPGPNWHPARLRQAYAALNPSRRADWVWFDPPAPARRNQVLADLIEAEPADVRWHTPEETARLLDLMNDVNRAKVDAARAKPGRSVGTVYKRTRVEGGVKAQRAEVRFDDVAGCLRTPGGGSSRQTIMVVEDGRVRTRLISARETARLMGLPEEYPLPARYNDAYHLTGDGVAVPVVRWIAEHVLEPVLDRSETKVLAA
ncbi:DNA cytosine methyltransferase [Sphingomonas lenta]|uniref:DNA (cytosine-5-)-methyltransferase n=1 Tax=Sphingomonas lenta TaxID=1141887 RepID=A0A2A2SBG8_9SPHN|nr:DNA cytosine methyltransferase [Sphingomonas lenta]PAX06530.1 DNA (cytosine-5-)-methyltransferase [Sphingomonas lenta]